MIQGKQYTDIQTSMSNTIPTIRAQWPPTTDNPRFSGLHDMSTTQRMQSPPCMSWKPSLISASLRWCVTYSSIFSLPWRYSAGRAAQHRAQRRTERGGGTGLTLDQARDLRAALDAAERRPPPGAAGDQLEPVRDRRRQLLQYLEGWSGQRLRTGGWKFPGRLRRHR